MRRRYTIEPSHAGPACDNPDSDVSPTGTTRVSMNTQPGLAQSLWTGADLPGQQGCAGGLEAFSVSEQAPIGLMRRTAATSIANRILTGAFIGWLSILLLHAEGQSELAGLRAARFLVVTYRKAPQLRLFLWVSGGRFVDGLQLPFHIVESG